MECTLSYNLECSLPDIRKVNSTIRWVLVPCEAPWLQPLDQVPSRVPRARGQARGVLWDLAGPRLLWEVEEVIPYYVGFPPSPGVGAGGVYPSPDRPWACRSKRSSVGGLRGWQP